MRFLRPLPFLAFATLSSCALYDAELLENATAGSGDGGSVSTGGATASGGGTGGQSVGTGGSDPGGSGGGGTTGGTGGSPDGTGGTPGPVVIGLCEGLCLDHMNHPASGSSWKNPAGAPVNIGFNWGKYDDGLGTWTSPASAAMFMSPRADHPNSAGSTEKELRITGSGFSDYGIGVYVKLNSSGAAVPVNLKAPIAYAGVKFWAKLNGEGSDGFSVALEDSASTTGSAHPKSAAQFLTTEWQLYTLAFEDFAPAVLADQVIAVHFVMDPADPYNVDFSIDDLYFYE